MHRRGVVWCHEIKNLMDKYAIAVQKRGGKVVRHLPLGKSGKFAKAIFYFLKADKKTFKKRINVFEKVANGSDGLGMKVPCRFLIFADEKKYKCFSMLL